MNKIGMIFLILTVLLIAGCGKPDPKAFLPVKCQLDGEFTCTEISANGNTVTLTIQNLAGVDATDVEASVTGCTSTDKKTISHGATEQINLNCNTKSGEYFKGDLTLNYIARGNSQSATGSIGVRS